VKSLRVVQFQKLTQNMQIKRDIYNKDSQIFEGGI